MKSILALTVVMATSLANAKTFCSSDKNGEGTLLSLKGRNVKVANLQVDEEYRFGKKRIKIVDFYVTGGPEQGATVVDAKGKKFDMWCTDEETPSDD